MKEIEAELITGGLFTRFSPSSGKKNKQVLLSYTQIGYVLYK